MKFLLVNDDGFGSEGITIVEEILKEYGEVFVVAPKEHQSGKGCSLFFKAEYNYEKIDPHHYIVEGTPAMCTMFGLGALNQQFDCVVSGCNDGWNLTCDTMYSGTVGACVESLFGRVSAIALSAQSGFDIVKKELGKVLDYIFNNELLSKDYMLNVNFPKEKSKGIKLTSMHPAKIEYEFFLCDDGTYSYRRKGVFDDAKRGSDVYAVMHDYISITPLRMNLFKEKDLEKLKK